MGKKLKKKEPQKKKASRRNCDVGRDYWGLCGSNSSDSESPQNKDEQAKEISGMNLLSSGDTFLCSLEDNESDNETTEFSLIGERERNQIEAEFKRLTDKIKDQKDLIDKREFSYKEEVTRLKAQLEEGNKIKKKYKEKEDQSQRLQDEVTSLRNEVNEKDTTTKELIERTIYCEDLEAMVISLKEDLKNSNKQNEELLQAFEEQENEILELRQQVEEGRKAE